MCQRNVAVAAALHALLLMLMVPVAPILVAAESFEASPTSPTGVPKGPGKCTTHYYEQTVDHFNWGKPAHANYTYRQRYFVCDEHWKNESGHVGPMFFYFGNEDNVELYLNNTGLMWESAPEFGALLIFAEHRYYGESIPATDSDSGCMNLLTTEQAMADFAKLIVHLKVDLMGDAGAPVVGFGGSYGGMIAAWFRMKFPTVVDGVIAASAPIWSFLGMDPPYDPNAYMETVTVDATPAGGASAHCASNYAIAQPLIVNLTATEKGRALLSKAFRTCSPVTSHDGFNLMFWTQGPWSYLAMGNYPYPSGYIIHGNGQLAAWPMRKACSFLAEDYSNDTTALMEGVREAMNVYYNHSGDVPCFFNGGHEAPLLRRRHMAPSNPYIARLHSQDSASNCYGNWDYQWCTEMTQPFTSGVGKDMFYPPSRFNLNGSIASCKGSHDVMPRPYWANLNLASKDLSTASNIVFSNGKLDPWHRGGVLKNVSDSVVAVVLPNGAHHLDLMFSNPADPPDAVAARETERQHMRRWVARKRNTYTQHTEL